MQRKKALLFSASPAPTLPPRHKCLSAPPPRSGLRSPAPLCSQRGMFPPQSPSLKRAREPGCGEERERVCRLTPPPSLTPLCGFLPLLFSACQGDRDQPRPGVPGHCLPQPGPEHRSGQSSNARRQRSQATISEWPGHWESS